MARLVLLVALSLLATLLPRPSSAQVTAGAFFDAAGTQLQGFAQVDDEFDVWVVAFGLPDLRGYEGSLRIPPGVELLSQEFEPGDGTVFLSGNGAFVVGLDECWQPTMPTALARFRLALRDPGEDIEICFDQAPLCNFPVPPCRSYLPCDDPNLEIIELAESLVAADGCLVLNPSVVSDAPVRWGGLKARF